MHRSLHCRGLFLRCQLGQNKDLADVLCESQVEVLLFDAQTGQTIGCHMEVGKAFTLLGELASKAVAGLFLPSFDGKKSVMDFIDRLIKAGDLPEQ